MYSHKYNLDLMLIVLKLQKYRHKCMHIVSTVTVFDVRSKVKDRATHIHTQTNSDAQNCVCDCRRLSCFQTGKFTRKLGGKSVNIGGFGWKRENSSCFEKDSCVTTQDSLLNLGE
jgi:hypothetical protein